MAKKISDVAYEADQLNEKADHKRGAYLREHGWEYTSTTPGCYWMWCKVSRGKQWSYFKAADALRAQSWMQEMGEDADGVPAVQQTVTVERLRQHWLHAMECDHATGRDKPHCACSRVDLGWHPSVGAAVEAWLAHIAGEGGNDGH